MKIHPQITVYSEVTNFLIFQVLEIFSASETSQHFHQTDFMFIFQNISVEFKLALVLLFKQAYFTFLEPL